MLAFGAAMPHRGVHATLGRNERIRRRVEFQKVYEQGARIAGRFMTLIVLPSERRASRLGVVAERKLGGASRRNRAKRLGRELFRLNKPPAGLDLVIVPRPQFLEAPFVALQADYEAALARRHGQRRR